ncbi:hypothetical protein ACMWQA_26610, partial [Escherichia coli]|uniref:hypothetical protein n=1 Tax=Escherichia coli TaxID=562 RepID=UPI0039E10146
VQKFQARISRVIAHVLTLADGRLRTGLSPRVSPQAAAERKDKTRAAAGIGVGFQDGDQRC